MLTEEKILNALREVYDPEIPINIVDLGLIYEVKINETQEVYVKMTLTTPGCPIASFLVSEVQNKLESIEGIKKAIVDLVFDPPWDPSMIKEEAKNNLGI